jgi:hypothetical protein
VLRSPSVADTPELFDVLWALYLLTSGDLDDDVHDLVPAYHVRLEAGGSAVAVDEILATLTEMGLAKTTSISDGPDWVGITSRGIHFISSLTSGALG